MVCHNPESNMGNAVGCPPVLQLFQKGILIGLGTDAYTHDMLESLKVLPAHAAAQRLPAQRGLAGGHRDASLKTTPKSAPGTQKPLGVLSPGAAADVIIMDYKPFTPSPTRTWTGNMLFGMEGKNCRTTIINGKVLYKDRGVRGH